MAENIGAVGSERNPTLIADFFYDHSTEGDQSAGAKHTFTAVELETDEVAEIEYLEIFSPQIAGVAQDLKQVIPVLDGIAIEDLISLSGRYDTNMAPPRINQMAGPTPLMSTRKVFKFGESGMDSKDPETGAINPLVNTTLKLKKKINVYTLTGTGAVTQDYRIRAYGYIYKEDAEMREVYGDRVYGAEAPLIDHSRGMRLGITKEAIDVSRANWDSFVGGVKQAKPQIMPMIRYAYNAADTTANTAYDFDYDSSKVADTWENLFFDYNTSEAVFIKGLGVRCVANLKYLGVKIGDREYPRGGGDEDLFRVDYNNNPFHFGFGYPIFPDTFPIYLSIPQLPLGYLVHNEKGRVIVYDDGTKIDAGDVVVAMQGIKVDM